MNNFLEEKEKLLNSIENNTAEHWKEYYKNVPLDCIFDDLVIDINEIKRLTEENKKLKEDISFCLKSIKQKMEMSTDSRTKQEMLSCYQILSEWSDK